MAKTQTKAPQPISLTARLALRLIALYRLLLSPLIGPRCRFYPSCSLYAQQAISAHGLWRGGWLSAKRLLKCHPGHDGGFDAVPETTEQNSRKRKKYCLST